MDDARAREIAEAILNLRFIGGSDPLEGLVLAVQKGYALGIIESWEKS